jgi:NAD(P)-dependent dehydrogenase (short-subunit alcohol dehydrogenase family)
VTADITRYRPAPGALRERVVLVTGAGGGIGRAVARDLARAGATVGLLGRTPNKLESTYDEIVKTGGPKPALLPFDLERALAQDYDRLAAAVGREFGRLDGLIHCAAILGSRTPIEHYDVPTWCRVLHINLTAGFVVTQVLLPQLAQSADPCIVFTTSSVGHRGRAYWGAYSASKFGTEGLAQVLADELEGKMRVNLVNPGPVRTNMRAVAYPAEDRSTLAAPEDVTGPYLYLVGPDSRGVTGQRFDCQPQRSGTPPQPPRAASG